MKSIFTKLAFLACSIVLFSGIILIRAMTTTDTQTIIEDITTAQDQMMDEEQTKSAMDTTMTTEMQEIAEPDMDATQEFTDQDEEAIGEEFMSEEPTAITEQTETTTIDEQPVADEEGTPSMEDMSEQEKAEQEAQEVNVFIEDESPAEELAP